LNQTKLAEDCAAHVIVGRGRDDYLRLGISYDTRDYEPDLNRGVFIDAEVDLRTAALGYSPIPEDANLVPYASGGRRTAARCGSRGTRPRSRRSTTGSARRHRPLHQLRSYLLKPHLLNGTSSEAHIVWC